MIGGGEPALAAHRRGHLGGEVEPVRAGLVAVDLLQPEHVGVQQLHRVPEPVDVDLAVGQATCR